MLGTLSVILKKITCIPKSLFFTANTNVEKKPKTISLFPGKFIGAWWLSGLKHITKDHSTSHYLGWNPPWDTFYCENRCYFAW